MNNKDRIQNAISDCTSYTPCCEMVGTFLSPLVSQKNSAILMVHPVISDHLNYYLVAGFNYKICELLPDHIVTELRFIARTSSLGQKTVTSEIMIVRDVLEMEGKNS